MSLVRFAAQNHPQQPVKDSVDDRRTPRSFFDPLHARHGFTLDAAASDDNALLPRYYTRADNALLQPWDGRVWCNPPYSRLEPWLAKAWTEMRRGTDLIVMLLPANRTEQRWWHEHVEPFRDGRAPSDGIRLTVEFVRGRVHLLPPPGYELGPSERKKTGPPFGSVVLTWDKQIGSEPFVAQRPSVKETP